MKKKIIISVVAIAVAAAIGSGAYFLSVSSDSESGDTSDAFSNITIKEESVTTNDVKTISPEDLIDLSETEADITLSIGNYRYLSKLDESDVADDEVWEETAEEEGIYEFEIIATDAEENEATYLFTLYLDTTDPEITAENIFIAQEDLDATPSYALPDDAVTDNFDEDLSGSDAAIDLQLTDEESHIYSIHIQVTDTAGNEAEKDISATIITPQQAEASGITLSDDGTAINDGTITIQDTTSGETANTNNNSGGSDSSSSGSGSSSSGSSSSSSGSSSSSSGSSSSSTSSIPVGYNSAYAYRVLELCNEQRAQNGLAALSWNDAAASAANTRAAEIVSVFSHTRPDGTSCFTALDEAGVSYMSAGENIAAGQISPESVVNAWMNSEGHRANILNGSYTSLGVSCYYDGTYHWVQLFVGD